MATSKKERKGILFAIGGHEDKSGEMQILRRVADCVEGKRMVVATLASSIAPEMWIEYRKVFREAGLKDIVHLSLENRPATVDQNSSGLLEGAGGVFFTGGDQLQITSKLGGTELCQQIHEIYLKAG